MAGKQAKRLTIGLTGIFGSGKSSVAKILKSFGASVIDCDQLVREGYLPGAGLQPKILKLFGRERLDRNQIAKIVFQNKEKRKKLEAIIHPFVFKRVHEELSKARGKITVIEMPLLFETGFNRNVDCVAVVAAKKEAIEKRLAKKGFTKRGVQLRWRAQWSLARKKRGADFVIENSGSVLNLKKQVKKLWRELNFKLAS